MCFKVNVSYTSFLECDGFLLFTLSRYQSGSDVIDRFNRTLKNNLRELLIFDRKKIHYSIKFIVQVDTFKLQGRERYNNTFVKIRLSL